MKKEIAKKNQTVRNNMDPAEYKHVLLGLIFLKYISDSFGEVYKGIITFECCTDETANQ